MENSRLEETRDSGAVKKSIFFLYPDCLTSDFSQHAFSHEIANSPAVIFLLFDECVKNADGFPVSFVFFDEFVVVWGFLVLVMVVFAFEHDV